MLWAQAVYDAPTSGAPTTAAGNGSSSAGNVSVTPNNSAWSSWLFNASAPLPPAVVAIGPARAAADSPAKLSRRWAAAGAAPAAVVFVVLFALFLWLRCRVREWEADSDDGKSMAIVFFGGVSMFITLAITIIHVGLAYSCVNVPTYPFCPERGTVPSATPLGLLVVACILFVVMCCGMFVSTR